MPLEESSFCCCTGCEEKGAKLCITYCLHFNRKFQNIYELELLIRELKLIIMYRFIDQKIPYDKHTLRL